MEPTLNYVKGKGWTYDEELPVATVKQHNGYTVQAFDRQPEDGEMFVVREALPTIVRLKTHLEGCQFRPDSGLKYPHLGRVPCWTIKVVE